MNEETLEFKRRFDLKIIHRKFEKSKSGKRRRCSSGNTFLEEPKVENVRALIVDNGAYSIKVDYSTSNEPKIIPNCIMKAKSERKRLFIGNQISECRDCSGLYYLLPCERGYITKWDVQKPVWDYTFSKNICPINDHPVVITQPLFNFKTIQDCMDELFFEEYEVPSMLRLNPTDMARLKYKEDHKLKDDHPVLMVDTGFSFTHIIPYIKGNKYLNGIKRLNVGGKLLTNHLKDIISYRQYNVMEETYVINQVKEDTCYVAADAKAELKLAEKTDRESQIVKNYVLPDFNNIRRGYIQDVNKKDDGSENCQILRLNNERFLVPEILFHPSDIGMKSMGIAEAIVKSICLCPEEYQEHLAQNIVVIGGNCRFSGFKERLYSELRSLLPDTWKVGVFQPEDPISYTWKSGKSLLRFPNIKSLFVTKEEYEELGSGIIQQRFNHWNNSIVVDPKEKSRSTTNEDYSMLEMIGKSIFGKHEPETSNQEQKNEEKRNEAVDKASTSNEENEEETNGDDESTIVSKDGITLTKKRKDKKNNKSNTIILPQNEDPLNDKDLFPFDDNLYI